MTKDGKLEAIDYSKEMVARKAREYQKALEGYSAKAAEINAAIDEMKRELAEYGQALDAAKANFQDAAADHNRHYGHQQRDAA